jgi:hypothetical protein
VTLRKIGRAIRLFCEVPVGLHKGCSYPSRRNKISTLSKSCLSNNKINRINEFGFIQIKQKSMISIGIIGGSGYTAGELIRF